MQTKNNLWISATIIANIIIVGILAGLLIAVAGFGYLGVFGIGIAINENIWIPIIGYILGSAILIFSIWLGIRSVLKKTPIDPQNHIKIVASVVGVSIILQILSSIYSYWLSGSNGLNVGYFLSSIVNDFVLFLSTSYFLKRNSNEESSNSYLIALIVVLLIGTGLTFWTAQRDASITDTVVSENNEVSDWKTYRNEEYGFEFKYPASFQLIEGVLYPDGYHDGVTIHDHDRPVFIVEYITDLNEYPMGASLPRNNLEEALRQDYQDISYVKVDGLNGYKVYFYNDAVPYSADKIWVEKNGKYYVLTYNQNLGPRKIDTESEKILASFHIE